MTTRAYASADDILRFLVEDLKDVTLMIAHPEPGLVQCGLVRREGPVGDLRLEAYDAFATFTLTDPNGDDVLLGDAFYGQPEAARQSIEFLRDKIAAMPSPGIAPRPAGL